MKPQDTNNSTGSLTEHYQRLLREGTLEEQRVAKAQLTRLRQRSRTRRGSGTGMAETGDKSRLVKLVEAAVGPLTQRPNGDWRGGCPWHTSCSGTCLSIFDGGRGWYCHSCHRGGDLVAWYALRDGISREAAFHKYIRSRFTRHPQARKVRHG